LNKVHIWSIQLDQPTRSSSLAKLLSAEETARAARFHFARDAHHYTVGRATLRLILSQYLALPPAALTFDYNAYGKPLLAPAQNPVGLAFNLTHSGGHALCAITHGHAVGIDLEVMRELDYLQMAGTVFSAQEQAILRSLPVTDHQRAFYNGWTRKEAYIKAHGQGLSMPLADFDVTLAPHEPARLLATRPDPSEAARWSLYGWSIDTDRVAALAVAGQDWQIDWHESSDLQ
jgi:4'-phosphopantetheinyl transferase